MKVYKTWLPLFPGFYGTRFEPNEDWELEILEEKRGSIEDIEWKEYDFDYDSYRKETAEECCCVVEDLLKEHLECTITFEFISSPKYYNFSNDSINISVELDLETLKKLLEDNFDEWKEHISETYTSRSRFISFYSNDAEDWWELLDEGASHCVGKALQFLIREESLDVDIPMVQLNNFEELLNKPI